MYFAFSLNFKLQNYLLLSYLSISKTERGKEKKTFECFFREFLLPLLPKNKTIQLSIRKHTLLVLAKTDEETGNVLVTKRSLKGVFSCFLLSFVEFSNPRKSDVNQTIICFLLGVA